MNSLLGVGLDINILERISSEDKEKSECSIG